MSLLQSMHFYLKFLLCSSSFSGGEPQCTYKEEQNFLLLDLIPPLSFEDFGRDSRYSLEGLMLKLKLEHFVHLMRSLKSLEKTLMLGNIEGRKRRGQQKMR